MLIHHRQNPTKINYYGDQIEEDERGRACRMQEREMKNAYKFWLENMKGRNHSENLGVDRGII
jgi:hypothetical protein